MSAQHAEGVSSTETRGVYRYGEALAGARSYSWSDSGAHRGFDSCPPLKMNAETLRFLALRGWLRLVVGSCPWCATRQAIAMIEAEGGRRHSDGKGTCDSGGLCDDKMKLFLPSKPRPGETATESTSVECRCRARAYSVQVGKRSVVICWKCAQEKASSV